MIIGNLKNTEQYENLHPLFKQAFDYIKSIDFSKAETGKTELQNKDLFVMVSDSTLKNAEDAKLEIHDKYIDIQVPVTIPETYGWLDRSELKSEKAPMDKEKDIQFFSDKPASYTLVTPGNFVIFYPEDAHAPCVGEGVVRKVVVKVKL